MDVWAASPQPSWKRMLCFSAASKGGSRQGKHMAYFGKLLTEPWSSLGFVSWRGCSVAKNILELTSV